MKYQVKHVTSYKYQWKVSTSQTKAWLLPRNLPYQSCEEQSLVISPQPTDIQHHRDFFGNWTSYFALNTPHDSMVITASSIIERTAQPDSSKLLKTDVPWNRGKELLKQDPLYEVELSQFMYPSPFIVWNKAMIEYAAISFNKNISLFECVRDLMHRIFTEFEFKAGYTTLNTPISTVMKERKGVCQDFSHLFLALLRAFGVPARYVSGYLETLPPPGKKKLQGSDASHAWIAAYIPGRGWTDFDPTNDVLPGERHITLGWGRDYSDVPPVKGVIQSSGKHELAVAVDIIPMNP